jgi:hypothetical protein
MKLNIFREMFIIIFSDEQMLHTFGWRILAATRNTKIIVRISVDRVRIISDQNFQLGGWGVG